MIFALQQHTNHEVSFHCKMFMADQKSVATKKRQVLQAEKNSSALLWFVSLLLLLSIIQFLKMAPDLTLIPDEMFLATSTEILTPFTIQ